MKITITSEFLWTDKEIDKANTITFAHWELHMRIVQTYINMTTKKLLNECRVKLIDHISKQNNLIKINGNPSASLCCVVFSTQSEKI